MSNQYLYPTEYEIKHNYIGTIEIAALKNHQSVVEVVLGHAKERRIYSATQAALRIAVTESHDALCQFLVQKRALDDRHSAFDDFDNSIDDTMPETLVQAIRHGNIALVKATIGVCSYRPRHTLLWRHTPGGDSLFEVVAEQGSIEMLQKVLSLGLELNPGDHLCYRALLRASSKGNTEIISYFLQHGFDANGTYCSQDADFDDDMYFDVSEELGLDPDMTLLIQSLTPWDTVDLDEQMSSSTEFLLDHGVQVDTVGPNFRTALAEAVKQEANNIEVVNLLLERGANPLVGLENSENALDWAIVKRKLEMTELLLQAVAARGDQRLVVDSIIQRYNVHPRDWSQFYVNKALKQFHWRTVYPVPA